MSSSTDETLINKSCVPCHGGVSALSQAEAEKMLSRLLVKNGASSEDKGWKIVEDGKALKREFKFPDFYRTMSFVNAVAHIANIEDHHPDLEVGWGYCNVVFSTHAVKGLSENDFICAAKIDALFEL